jgi:exopolysaccharide production protein ExoZ
MQFGGSTGKYTGIQALRFVAALLVVATHATLYTSERLDSSLPVWHFGEVGVDLFFVVSGFVMMVSTQSLVARRDGWRTFALRRIVRIVPMYWIATTIKLLALVAVPGAVLHAALDPGKTVLSYFFLPSRNIDGDVQPLLAVGWTLTFEMFFYAVFALALFLRASRPVLAGAVLAICASGWLFREAHWPPGQWPPAAVYFDPIVLYFLIGMIIGSWTTGASARKCALGLSGVLLFWAVLRALDPADRSVSGLWDVTKPAVVTLVVLALVVLDPVISGRIPRPITFMGDASYSLYLFHPLVAPMVPATLSFLGIRVVPLSLVLCVVAAVLAAAVIYRFVESPLTTRLQRRVSGKQPVLPPRGPTRAAA